jgi:hypothetical protein
MGNSIRLELLSYLKDLVNDGVLTDDNRDEWHYEAFNADYYIVGYYNAEQWLKRHDISAFEAIADCIEFDRDMFGEVHLKPEDINPEKIVNLYTYIKGEELLNDLNADNVAELVELINDELEG